MKKLITLLFICLAIVVKAQTVTIIGNNDLFSGVGLGQQTYLTRSYTQKMILDDNGNLTTIPDSIRVFYNTHYNSKGDTVIIRTTVKTTTSIDSVVKKFVSKPVFVKSSPVVLRSNTNYSYLNIDLGGTAQVGINGSGVSNVHISKLTISNTTGFAIFLQHCTNITIDSVFIHNVGFGVYAQYCKGIKVNGNQLLNINGINASYKGHAIQFDNVTGGGNHINNNRIENIAGQALHPHDMISVFQSSGLPGDSIQVIGNWIRGGQVSLWPDSHSGACGIGFADGSGSYEVCRGNILVRPGYAGIQPIGSSANGIKIDHNLVYSSKTPVSLVGISAQIGSGSSIEVSNNRVNWTTSNGTLLDWWMSGVTPIGWGTNKYDGTLSENILPPVIITMK